MLLLESIRMSWVNITNNKLRSFLTMLGIIIGVASIIALITIVQGATMSISEQITELGANKITINAPGTPLKRGLSQDDLENISQVKNISGVSPTISNITGIASKDIMLENIAVQGKNEVYFTTDASLIQSGRPINILDLKGRNRVALIGSNIVQKFYYGRDPLGQEILINGVAYRVIGTLTASHVFSMSSNNDTVLIPYTTALRSLGVRNITTLDVFLVDTDLAEDTVLDLKAVLNRAFNYKEDAYTIFNMGDVIESFQEVMSMMSLLLAGIAAISLVVGGIGIMNMMLVSITERTAEIGLRKALGATPNRIQLQFIIEAIFLSIIGGLIGLFLGALIAYLVSTLIGVGFFMTVSTVTLAVGFSAGVGIIFGYMPARKASKLNPIDALRSL